MVMQDTNYLNAITRFPVVDNVAQSRVFSISHPNIVTALPKPGVGGQEAKHIRQFINVLLGLFMTPLGKRIQPNRFHIASRFRRKPVFWLRHV
jgi:hypothetical protein